MCGVLTMLLISEGRGAAAEVDTYLQHNTRLPVAGSIRNRIYTAPQDSPSSIQVAA